MYAWKIAAHMQALQMADRTILCRTATEPGHGAGTPPWMIVEGALGVRSLPFPESSVEI